MFAELTEEWDTGLRSADPLRFPGYADKVATLDHESVRTGLVGAAGGEGYVLIEGDFDVIGGSMGLVHGEKVVRAFDRATEARLPVVVVTRSGGARMQEGMVSLVQMARASAAARRHSSSGLLSIAVHRSPTTGGVFASYGSLTDLSVAEAGATIGFAGPRVVAEVTGAEVDGTSHTAESALAAGLIDAVRAPDELPAWVAAALGTEDAPLHAPRPPNPIRPAPDDPDAPPAWREVRAARRMGRPSGIHVAAAASTSWTELGSSVDRSLRTALATVDGRRVVAVAFDRYGGKPTPAGYRLAQRGIALAGRLGLPVVCFVDTIGADPSPTSENDGIAGEIARTLAAMAEVASPTVAICVGEGGSGGALALAAADRFLIQEHAVFSVIGPEGAAAILERDGSRAPAVAGLLRLTSADLLDLGIVDEVVTDEVDGAVVAVHRALAGVCGDDGGGGGHGGGDGGGRERLARFDRATHRWLTGP